MGTTSAIGGYYAAELAAAERAAHAAAEVLAAEFMRPEGARGSYDKSPADTEAERIIRELLVGEFPEYGFRAEEEAGLDRPATDPHRHAWVVDPNDGTVHFLRGLRGAAVSIALLRGDTPVLGVVLAHTAVYGGADLFTWAEGCGPARRNGSPLPRLDRRRHLQPGDVVLSAPSSERSVMQNAEAVAPARFRPCPSIAYRLALVAAGEAVATLSVSAPGPLDYAAGDALLRGVGGELVDGRGVVVQYGAVGRSTPAVFGGPRAVVRELASRHWAGVVSARRRLAPVERCEPIPGCCVRDDALLRRAQGALLGQLAGDALGSLVEFESARSISAAYPGGVRELVDGGTWDTIAGQPTDDSELALSLARAVVEHGWDAGQVAVAYARWFGSKPFDVGGTTRTALGPAWRALQDGASPAEVAEIAASSATTESKANGALMRISPLALLGWDQPVEVLAAWASEDARLTHPNKSCQDASAVYVAAIAFALRQGADAVAVYRHALAVADQLEVESDVADALRRAESEPPSFTPHDGYVAIALQNAFFQLLHAPSFEEALVSTIAGGGDTDTNAAIAGALVGAVRGITDIPLRWRNAVLSCRPLRGLPGVNTPRPSPYWPVDALVVAERLVARQVPPT